MTATFTFTPSYVHAAHRAYVVRVDRYDDLVEQRLLGSRQAARSLTYEFPHVSSSMVWEIETWFQGQNGAVGRFNILDHRDGTTYLGRFPPTLSHQRQAPRQRSMQVTFTLLTSGFTDPVGVAFVRPDPPDCTITWTGSYTPPSLPES